MFLRFLNAAAPPFFVLGFSSAVLSFWSEVIGGMASRGKTRPSYLDSTANALKSYLYGDAWSVPKRLFLHYYLAGFFTWIFIVVFWRARLSAARNHSASSQFGIDHPMTPATAAILLVSTVHCLRRSYECYAVHKFSTSGQMHLLFYVIGILYYIFLPAILVDLPCSACETPKRIPTSVPPHFVGVVILFAFWAQYQQYRHHVILANLRKPTDPTNPQAADTSDNSYKIPVGGWFQYVTCPHYTAEVLLYLTYGVLIWADGRVPLQLPDVSKGVVSLSWEYRYVFTLAFVVLNLYFSALDSHRWYTLKFDEYKDLNRTVMFPFVR